MPICDWHTPQTHTHAASRPYTSILRGIMFQTLWVGLSKEDMASAERRSALIGLFFVRFSVSCEVFSGGDFCK